MSTQQSSMAFKELDAEIWFAKRLVQLLTPMFVGTTERAIRKERFRNAIISAGLEKVILGKRADGKCETCAEGFERLYGEPLQPKQQGKSRG